MSWTACYNDDCRNHLSDKEGPGWYPKPPRKQRLRTMFRGSPENEDFSDLELDLEEPFEEIQHNET